MWSVQGFNGQLNWGAVCSRQWFVVASTIVYFGNFKNFLIVSLECLSTIVFRFVSNKFIYLNVAFLRFLSNHWLFSQRFSSALHNLWLSRFRQVCSVGSRWASRVFQPHLLGWCIPVDFGLSTIVVWKTYFPSFLSGWRSFLSCVI